MSGRILFAWVARLLPIACVACAGCAAGGSTVTIPAWQREVEGYVKERGSGDPTVLADVTLPDGRPGFAVIGKPQPAESTDVSAVLLGHRAIAGKPWFIYLAGQVEAQRVKAIQLAALSIEGGKFTWRLSPSSDAALARYRAYGEKSWREHFPNRASAPPGYLGFPRADDVFELTINEDHVVARERNSGTTWELWISGKAHPAGAGAPRVAWSEEKTGSTALSELIIPVAHSTMHEPQNVASRQ